MKDETLFVILFLALILFILILALFTEKFMLAFWFLVILIFLGLIIIFFYNCKERKEDCKTGPCKSGPLGVKEYFTYNRDWDPVGKDYCPECRKKSIEPDSLVLAENNIEKKKYRNYRKR